MNHDSRLQATELEMGDGEMDAQERRTHFPKLQRKVTIVIFYERAARRRPELWSRIKD